MNRRNGGIHEDMIESHRINKNLTKTGSPGSPGSPKISKEFKRANSAGDEDEGWTSR